jgi:hypothetical protein
MEYGQFADEVAAVCEAYEKQIDRVKYLRIFFMEKNNRRLAACFCAWRSNVQERHSDTKRVLLKHNDLANRSLYSRKLLHPIEF